MVQINHTSTAPLSAPSRISSPEWNATHELSLATSGALVGRYSAGSGAAEEITLGHGLAFNAAGKLINSQYFNVRDYGAVANGVTDDTAAFNAACDAIETAGGGTLLIPKGQYYLPGGTLSLPEVACVIRGEGKDLSIIKFGDSGDLFYRSSGAALHAGMKLQDFGIVGIWDTNQSDGGNKPILLGKIDYLEIDNVAVTSSRNFSISGRRCNYFKVTNCRVMKSARDGINFATCSQFEITNNLIHHCGDDAIANHSADNFLPIRQTGVIAHNRIIDSFGIVVHGALKIAIHDNILDLINGHGIQCGTLITEGFSGPLGLSIKDNIITDVMNRVSVDGVLNQLNYINIQPPAASTGGVIPIAPGEADSVTGAVVEPYEYNYSQNSSGAPLTGGYDITIEGNQCIRTRDVGTTFSSYGFGQMFAKNGWYDPTLTSAMAIEGTGIVTGASSGSTVRNLVVRNNTVRGVKNPLSVTGTKYRSTLISGNRFIDFPLERGITISSSSYQDVEISDNYFDGDPWLTSANRHATNKGAWQNATTPAAVYNVGGALGIKFLRNTIRNVAKVIDGSALAIEDGNIIECQFSAAGYSASNYGVGNLPAPGKAYWYNFLVGNSTSSNYDRILNACQRESAAMPATGYYMAGMFVEARDATVSGGEYLLGWLRLTTGNAHVLNTDWQEIKTGGTSGGAPAFTTVEVDLGSAKRAGKFTITGLSGLTVGKPVNIFQAVGAYTGKGTLADEAEMDAINVTATVTATDTITAYFSSQTAVKGNFKFNYMIGA